MWIDRRIWEEIWGRIWDERWLRWECIERNGTTKNWERRRVRIENTSPNSSFPRHLEDRTKAMAFNGGSTCAKFNMEWGIHFGIEPRWIKELEVIRNWVERILHNCAQTKWSTIKRATIVVLSSKMKVIKSKHDADWKLTSIDESQLEVL